MIDFPIIVTAIVALYLISSIKIITEYERAVIFRLGRLLAEPKGPGVILVFAPIDRIVRISLRVDTIEVPPQDVVNRLQSLAKPGEPWFGSAGEMTALALAKQGKNQEAGQLFAAIAKDNTVPSSIRERAAQLASSFGVDISNMLPNQAR